MASEIRPRGKVTVTRVYHFSAGHRLENPALAPDDNAALYGACHRPHGHNYYVEVAVTGVPDPVTGMAIDLGRLDEIVRRELLEQVDHRTLEDVPALAGVITTGESLAHAFWAIVRRDVPPGDRKSTRLNSSHIQKSRMPSSA